MSAQTQSIHQAAAAGNIALVQKILAGNPSLVNAKDDHGRTPLTEAVLFGRNNVAQLLLSNGAQMNAFDAAALGKTAALAKMISADPSLLDAKDATGGTLLLWAGIRHHKDTAAMLVNREAQVDVYSAAANGLTDKLAVLLSEHPALVNAKGPEGLTPLQVAVRAGEVNAATQLLKRGADPNVASAMGTALFDAARHGDEQIIRLLLEHGADRKHFVSGFGTAYTVALASGHKNAAELLKP